MKNIYTCMLIGFIYFKLFGTIHCIPVPFYSNTTEESSTSSDPSSNDASNSDPTGDGDGGDF